VIERQNRKQLDYRVLERGRIMLKKLAEFEPSVADFLARRPTKPVTRVHRGNFTPGFATSPVRDVPAAAVVVASIIEDLGRCYGCLNLVELCECPLPPSGIKS
jgi:hypothetical protein